MNTDNHGMIYDCYSSWYAQSLKIMVCSIISYHGMLSDPDDLGTLSDPDDPGMLNDLDDHGMLNDPDDHGMLNDH